MSGVDINLRLNVQRFDMEYGSWLFRIRSHLGLLDCAGE